MTLEQGESPRFSRMVTHPDRIQVRPEDYFKRARGRNWRAMYHQGRAIAAPTARQLEVSMVPHPLDRMQVSPRIS